MVLVGERKQINRVQIIDDDPKVREVYEFPVEELNLQPVQIEGPLPELEQFVQMTLETADAAICDYQLRVRNYANFNGAESVARLYQQDFPAILCTRYETASIDEMRKYRKFIPVLLKPDELDPESLLQGLEQCVEEFSGVFRSSRKAWRTLVRFEDVDLERSFIYVVIPGWDPNKIVRLNTSDVPKEIRDTLRNNSRFFANVNIGAEKYEELYFSDWEIE